MPEIQQPTNAAPNAPRRAKSIGRFCEDWEFGRTKVYELIKAGKLRAVRIGGQRRILAEDEEAFAASLPSR